MNPEQWQQLDELFHSALEHDPGDRAAFLDEVCAGNDSLRRQVESLVAAHAKAGSFIESPAMEVEAREVAADQANASNGLANGEIVSHYRIMSPLGSGGMGHVYLAEDMVLNRQVALKLLPEFFTRDEDRLRRFQQEARAASALNHPNIITIYEFGEFNERHFIATEFIDGPTLRQKFFCDERHGAGKRSKLREVLDIAVQTADALAAAHEAGIVHRDIKPENVMVRRRDGYVKVLDFGLAKLTEDARNAEASSRANVNTSAGRVMGTVSYMSPEQVRAESVDERTDIWSLGVVVYEMVAGCTPFNRLTPGEVIALILEREPPPLAHYSRDVPAELERIITKALIKDKEERYQTAKDLLVDLRRLRQQLDVEAEIERTTPRGLRPGAADDKHETAVSRDAAQGETLSATRSTSSLDYLAGRIGRHKRGALVLLLMVLAAGGYFSYRWASRRWFPAFSFQEAKWTRLTTNGKVTLAIISPDGKFVVHVVDDAGRQSLRLRQVATSDVKEIIAPASVMYRSLTFTPDGNYIYYTLQSKELLQPTLFRVSTLGGDPKRVPVKVEGDWVDLVRRGPVSFSPDGKRFVFRRVESDKETTLVIANTDGSGEQKLVTHRTPEVCGLPAWSRDGQTIAYAMGNSETNDATVFAASVANADSKPLASQRWHRVGRIEWLADGRGLLMLATAGAPGSSYQIWHLSHPGGEARNLSNNLNNYADLSLTADSSAVAAVQFEQQGNIWIAPATDIARAQPITFEVARTEGGQGISWTPDGRLVYCSVTGDGRDIWIIDADGKNRKQLTATPGVENHPSVAPDGGRIFFLSDHTGTPHIWQMDLEGGDLKQLTNGDGEQNPICSPDGRWVVYRTVFSELNLWRVPVEGGRPVQITDHVSGVFAISPDGKLIAYFVDDEAGPRVAITPFEGDKRLATFELPESSPIRWTPEGRAVAYIRTQQGVSNLWAQPADGSIPKQLTNFNSDQIFWFEWSRDGKQLALSRGTRSSDVVMISNLR